MLLYDHRFLVSMAITCVIAIAALANEASDRVARRQSCAARASMLRAAGAVPDHPSGFL